MYFIPDNFHRFKIVIFIRDKRLEIDCILFYFKLDLIIFMNLKLLSLFETKDRLMYFIFMDLKLLSLFETKDRLMILFQIIFVDLKLLSLFEIKDRN